MARRPVRRSGGDSPAPTRATGKTPLPPAGPDEILARIRRLSPTLSSGQRKVVEFLEEGDKVKVTVRFRGRESERPEFGQRLLDRLAEEVAEVGTVEQPPSMEGRNLTMVLAPVRRPKPRAASDGDGPDDGQEETFEEDETAAADGD
jgi:hypothetical protein